MDIKDKYYKLSLQIKQLPIVEHPPNYYIGYKTSGQENVNDLSCTTFSLEELEYKYRVFPFNSRLIANLIFPQYIEIPIVNKVFGFRYEVKAQYYEYYKYLLVYLLIYDERRNTNVTLQKYNHWLHIITFEGKLLSIEDSIKIGEIWVNEERLRLL